MNGAAGFATPDARTLHVTNSPGAIINWQGFSIGAGELTRFTQQSAASAVLNRVVGADISKIQGQLLSNGRVLLINPAGILIGAGAVIDTAGFVGSTLNMSNADFLAGKLKFDGGTGTVRNEGTIKGSGDIYLVGPMVENAGAIRSENGNVVLAAGRSVTITSPTLDGVQFTLQAPSDTALNLGTIEAKNAVAMFAGTLRHSGDTHAGGMGVDAGGNIVLVAQSDLTIDSGSHLTASGTTGGNVTVQSGGTTLVGGVIDATGTAGKGGTVHLLGERVGVMANATVDASGETGGGTILVGGDFQGQNPTIHNSQATYLDPSASVKADAVSAGDGGKIILWSDGLTRSHGSISARGGAHAGDGGFVETSGHQLEVTRAPELGASAGRGGSWLIDPSNITIVAVGTDTTNGTAPGPFTPNGDSELTVATINNALNSGTNTITISTVGSAPAVGGSAGDVIFDAASGPIAIARGVSIGAAGNPGTLNVNAQRDIVFKNGATTFSTTAAPPPGPAAIFANALSVVLNPGRTVSTEQLATTALDGSGLGVTVRVAGGKPWQNAGTIDLSGNSTIILQDASTPALVSTLTNTGVMTIDSTATWSILSGGAQAGVLTNSGRIDVNRSTSWENQFNQTALGHLNIKNAATSLSMQNGRTIDGTIAIDAGAELYVSESHTDAGGATIIPASFTGTTFSTGAGLGGTLRIALGGGPVPQANFSGVTAGGTPVTIGDSAIVTIDGPTTFGAVDIISTTTGGTLGGAGALTSPSLTWNASSGSITGSGVKTFGNITTTTGGPRALTGNLALDTGTWNVPAGVTINQSLASQLTLSNGAAVTNDGTWNLASTNATPIVHGGGADTIFTNNNVFTSSFSPHTLTVSQFHNLRPGVVTVNNNSTLTLPAGDPTGSEDGTYSVDIPLVGNTNTLQFNGSRTLTGDIRVSGGGSGTTAVRFLSGDVNLQGTFSLAGAASSRVENTNANLLLNLAGPITFVNGFALTGTGTLAGSADVIMPAGRNFVLSGGTVTGTGALSTNGSTTISGAVTLDGRTWNNNSTGVVDVTGAAGQLTLKDGGRVINNATWTLSGTHATPLASFGPANAFTNNATFRKTSAGAQTIDPIFNNLVGATVFVDAGTLTLGPQTVNDAGTYNVTANLVFGASRTLANGSNVTGTGNVTFDIGTVSIQGDYSPASTTIQNTGAAAFNATGGGTLTIPNVTMTGGTLGGIQDLATSGTFNWSGGTISGGAGSSLIFGAGSTTNITGPVTLDTRSITNNGRVNQLNGGPAVFGQLTLAGGAVVTNNTLPGWFVTSSSPTPFKDDGGGTATRFDNFAPLDFSGNVDRTLTVRTFRNFDTTIIHNGVLRLPDGTTDNGIYNVQSGGGAIGTLIFDGNRTLGNTSNVSGSGKVIFHSGTVRLNNTYSAAGGAQTTIENTANVIFDTSPFDITANVLTITGGTLDGTANITASRGLAWSGGTIRGGVGSTFNTPGPSSSTISGNVTLDRRTWNNAGPVNQTGGHLTFASNATVNNEAGALWTVSSHDPIAFTGPGTFINDGTFRTTGGMPHTIEAGTTFRNRNLVQVLAGDLSFDGPGSHSGTFSVAGGSTIEFFGNQGFQNGAVITGAGGVDFSGGVSGFQSGARVQNLGSFTVSGATVGVQNGATYNAVRATNVSNGTLTFANAANTNSLNLSGGTIQGGSMTVNTGGTWSGGQLVTTGLTVAPGATLNLTGAALKRANNATLTNNGTMNVIGDGALLLQNGSVVQNAGLFDIRSDAQIAVFPGGPTSTFANTGTLQKSGGVDSTFQPSLTNAQSGTIHVSAGTLRVTGAFPVNDGTIVTEPLTTFSTNGMPLTNSATGVLMGKGTIDVGTSTLTNDGMVAPGASPGALVINGDYTQGPAGMLAIELAGPVQGVSYDLLQVNGTANLGGTLRVVTSGGYAPAAGQAFDFLTYARHTGDFATKTFPNASFQGVPGAKAYGVAVTTGSSGNPGMRNVAIEETERLRENFVGLISARDAELETRPAGRQVCN